MELRYMEKNALLVKVVKLKGMMGVCCVNPVVGLNVVK
jgi:hypothetical protein